MSDVFISYAHSTARQAQMVVEALRGLGYSVWIDDDLPAHRSFSRVIEEEMTAAKAAVVIWSADAVQSDYVLSEANRAREERKLVQVVIDKTRLPMPFDTIQCTDLSGWTGDLGAPGWRKVIASIADLVGGVAGALGPVPGAPPPLPSKPSIAVLPFANLSGDPEQEYFADGMVEEIATALSRIRSIFVIAGGSSLSFKGKGVGPQETARQLGVRYVLDGSVRKAGGRVRIALKLIDAADGAQIWADRFEDTLEDVFALQDRVALSVAARIDSTLTHAEFVRASARPTENMGGYDLYLRAHPLFNTMNRANVSEAIELLDRAIALDPSYGSALAMGGACRYIVTTFGWASDPEATAGEAIDLARRALRAAADDAQVLAQTALILADLAGDLSGGVAVVDRAIALNPGSAIAWAISGTLRVRIGDADLSAAHLETSLRLDPLGSSSLLSSGLLAQARLLQGRFAEAVALARVYVQQIESAFGYAILAASYGRLGQTAAASDALNHYRSVSPRPIDVFARAVLRDPAYVKLFLDGIALAEGESPAAGGSAAI